MDLRGIVRLILRDVFPVLTSLVTLYMVIVMKSGQHASPPIEVVPAAAESPAVNAPVEQSKPESNGDANILGVQLPVTMIDMLVPGYSFYAGLLKEHLGFDVTLIGVVCMGYWLLARSIGFFSSFLMNVLRPFAWTEVKIGEDDELYKEIIEYLPTRIKLEKSRFLDVKTQYYLTGKEASKNGLEKGGLFDGYKRGLKVPLKYDLPPGDYTFWHKRHYFKITKDASHIIVICISTSTATLKSFLQDCREHGCDQEDRQVEVFRPNASKYYWEQKGARDPRPMDSVNIDQSDKRRMILDMNEYLQQATAKWYRDRGIPWRRGYLFHGPPGTGKTTMATALAGLFGVNMYTVSLMDPNLWEEDLCTLFSVLPQKSIVLLEDIDSAGLNREKPMKRKQLAAAGIKDCNISLSGLLNAIDGVAAFEGAVLIMTTNHPELLDPALMRPGRVDMQVRMGNAGRDQMYWMFLRMYDPNDEIMQVVEDAASEVDRLLFPKYSKSKDKAKAGGLLDQSILEDLATKFSEALPEGVFSQAEIQGFLISHKLDPRRAVEQVEAWRDEKVKIKTQQREEQEAAKKKADEEPDTDSEAESSENEASSEDEEDAEERRRRKKKARKMRDKATQVVDPTDATAPAEADEATPETNDESRSDISEKSGEISPARTLVEIECKGCQCGLCKTRDSALEAERLVTPV